jgi:TolB-like protein
MSKALAINLFGACAVNSTDGRYAITGSKHKALFALLATAPFGRRTRGFLQEALWGVACYDTGRQSLRRALADIKAIMGEDFGVVLSCTYSDITLDIGAVEFLGHRSAGEFLEGLDIREAGFSTWLQGIRQHPAQLDALFRNTRETLLPSILPVVGVLPFRAIGGNPTLPILGDWLAEETCRSLCRSHLLSVISHLSSREFARTTFDLSGARARLGLDFCLAGTVREAGDQVVLDVDFVDVPTSRILWTRRFTGLAGDIAREPDIALSGLVRSIGATIADESIAHVADRPLHAIDDHRLLMAGVSLMHRSTLRDFARAKELLVEASVRAGHAAEIHAWLGKWYALSVFNGWSSDNARDTQFALDSTARALDLSPDNAFSLAIDGFAHCNLVRRLDVAERRYAAALESSPNEALAWLFKGALHTFRAEGTEAIESASRARALSPIDPFGYFYDAMIAGAHLAAGNFQEALELAERSLEVNDRHLSTLRIKLFALHFVGRTQEAAAVGRELLQRQPDFTIADYMRRHPSAEYPMGRMMAEALRTAQIPLGG